MEGLRGWRGWGGWRGWKGWGGWLMRDWGSAHVTSIAWSASATCAHLQSLKPMDRPNAKLSRGPLNRCDIRSTGIEIGDPLQSHGRMLHCHL